MGSRVSAGNREGPQGVWNGMNKIEKRIGKQVYELGRFVQFGQQVTVDTTRKILKVLPFSQQERLVEIPNEDVPHDEVLDLRNNCF